MPIIFHIVAAAEWPNASDFYCADTLASEGFIHCSTRQQLIAVANRLFTGKSGLLAVAIRQERVVAPVVYENLEGGAETFPHIYGPLNLDAVEQLVALRIRDDGTFELAPTPAGDRP